MLHPLVLLIYRIEEREIRAEIVHRDDGIAFQFDADITGAMREDDISNGEIIVHDRGFSHR